MSKKLYDSSNLSGFFKESEVTLASLHLSSQITGKTKRRALLSLDHIVLYPVNFLSFKNNHYLQSADLMFHILC